MRIRRLLVAVIGLLGAVGVATALAAGGVSWGKAIEVPGTSIINTANAALDSVSCPSARNCAAAGYYTNGAGADEAFVADEANGVWKPAIGLPRTAVAFSISCAKPGNCAVGGAYENDAKQLQAYVASESNGVWGTLIPLATGPNSQVNSVSCASAGNCVAGGAGNNVGGFVADETNGVWGAATLLAGVGSVDTVSCPATAGQCEAGGIAGTGAAVASETNGVWGNAVTIPGITALNPFSNVTSLSCTSVGNCAAGGYYIDPSNAYQVWVATEKNGFWNNSIEVPGTAALNAGGSGWLKSISCAKAGNCSAGGYYGAGSGNGQQAWVETEKNGVWGTAIEVPGTAALNGGGYAEVTSVSCAKPGNCAAGGDYSPPVGEHAFVVKEKNGKWGKAIDVPGLSALNPPQPYGYATSVSCAKTGRCAVGGVYRDTSNFNQAFVTAP